MSINYSNVMTQVSSIKRLSSEMNGVSKNLNSIMDEISHEWEAPSSKEFIRQCESLKVDIDKTARDMTNVADSISSVASQIKREEEARARAAAEAAAARQKR